MTALRDSSWSGLDRDEVEGRLVARPSAPTLDVKPGLYALGLARGRDALLYVPRSYDERQPAPLAVMLHGAGGDAAQGMSLLRGYADEASLVLLAPASRDDTWDLLLGDYGPDVDIIDAALDATSERCAIDQQRVAIGGFSDGASYALSLGLTNGDLFSRVIAFSPCILAPAANVGHPRIFISHGTDDRILPIDHCGRRLAARLSAAGYEVEFEQFAGPHAVPPDIARAAMKWATKSD